MLENSKLLAVIWTGAIFFSRLTDAGRNATDEERLNKMLFQYYDASVRPVYIASELVRIQFGLKLINISKMDEVSQILELTAWLEMYWKDKRLAWDPSDFNGLESILLPNKFIWVGDVVVYNAADEFGISGSIRAMIRHTGDIFLGPLVKIKSSCILDLTLYPFDDQICKIQFGSWSYDTAQLLLEAKNRTPTMSIYDESGVWYLLEASIEERNQTYACCKRPFSVIILSIKMRRKFIFNNLLNIFIPTCWLTFLTLLTFWLDPASGEKITLCITILVNFTLFQLLVAENTPRSSEFVPLLSVYLEVSYITTAVVVGIQVFILNLHCSNPILTAVPHWLRVVVLNIIAPYCLRINVENFGKAKKHKRPNNETTLTSTCDDNVSSDRACGLSDSTSSSGSLAIVTKDEEHIYEGIGALIEELQPQGHKKFLQRDYTTPYGDCGVVRKRTTLIPVAENVDGNKSSAAEPSQSPSNKRRLQIVVRSRFEQSILRHLLRSIGYMVQREDSTTLRDLVVAEWRMIAFVLDRLAFWIFAFITVSFFVLYVVALPIGLRTYHGSKRVIK